MSWYIHPSKQLRDDELPPELVVTNRNGSIVQAYVPCNAIDQLQAENAKLRHDLEEANNQAEEVCIENAKLRGLVRHLRECTRHNVCAACAYADDACDFDYDMRELGVEVDG